MGLEVGERMSGRKWLNMTGKASCHLNGTCFLSQGESEVNRVLFSVVEDMPQQ